MSGADHDHHPDCYQSTGVPEGLPAGLCDCRVLRMLDDAGAGGGEVSGREYDSSRMHVAAPVDGLCQTCGCGVDGGGDCPCGCVEAVERAREAFALGAAWALGDDEGTLADFREQVAMLTEQRDNAERKHEDLESGIEALANEWGAAVSDHLREGGPDRESRLARQFVRDLRALLPGAES